MGQAPLSHAHPVESSPHPQVHHGSARVLAQVIAHFPGKVVLARGDLEKPEALHEASRLGLVCREVIIDTLDEARGGLVSIERREELGALLARIERDHKRFLNSVLLDMKFLAHNGSCLRYRKVVTLVYFRWLLRGQPKSPASEKTKHSRELLRYEGGRRKRVLRCVFVKARTGSRGSGAGRSHRTFAGYRRARRAGGLCRRATCLPERRRSTRP